jgi:5-methylcytosine-specific restriction endonuclease McrA
MAEEKRTKKFGSGVVASVAASARASAAPAKRQLHAKRVSKNQHYISASDKRTVWAQAMHCQYPGCASTYGLEVDHIRPVAGGGNSTVANLRVLCRHHNLARALLLKKQVREISSGEICFFNCLNA